MLLSTQPSPRGHVGNQEAMMGYGIPCWAPAMDHRCCSLRSSCCLQTYWLIIGLQYEAFYVVDLGDPWEETSPVEDECPSGSCPFLRCRGLVEVSVRAVHAEYCPCMNMHEPSILSHCQPSSTIISDEWPIINDHSGQCTFTSINITSEPSF